MVSSVMINIRTVLRTFALDYHDLPTMIENVAILLRILTINIYNNSERKNNIYYIRRFQLTSLTLSYNSITKVIFLFNCETRWDNISCWSIVLNHDRKFVNILQWPNRRSAFVLQERFQLSKVILPSCVMVM